MSCRRQGPRWLPKSPVAIRPVASLWGERPHPLAGWNVFADVLVSGAHRVVQLRPIVRLVVVDFYFMQPLL